MNKLSFASDNYVEVHPNIMQAIIDVNKDHATAYGGDLYTNQAIELFKKHFGTQIDVYFVATGTAANVLGLSALLKPYQSVICAETAHINTDEAGAFEKYTGSKLLTIKSSDGKINIDGIKKQLSSIGNNQHRVQPKVISITQPTELGTLYTINEIKKLTDFAHNHHMYIHMDGARLSNAAAALNTDLASLTTEVGIDLLSFGGTKNGMMLGEAIIFFNKNLSKDFKHIHKQGMQLISKMRFISAQFIALFTNDLWKINAQHANNMALFLEKELQKIPTIKITRNAQVNSVFAYMDPKLIPIIQKEYFFYIWNELTSEVRFMTSFNTKKEDLLNFVKLIKKYTI